MVSWFFIESAARFAWVRGSPLDNLAFSGPDHHYAFLTSDQFKPVHRRVSAQKLPPPGPGTVRILTFGESTTWGSPWDQTLAYSNILQRILSRRWPHERFEVYNLAYLGQTYQFARNILRDAAPLQARYLIFYCGHNEMYPHNLYWTVRRAGRRGGFAADPSPDQ